MAAELLQQMRNISRPRLLRYAACRMLHSRRQEISLRQGFAQWSQTTSFLKEMSNVICQFDQYRRTVTIRKAFKQLKTVVRTVRAKRNLLSALLEKSVLLRKQAVFVNFVKRIRDKKATRQNKQVASTYRTDRLKRLALTTLRCHSLTSRRHKCLMGAVLFQRLIPKAFACL